MAGNSQPALEQRLLLDKILKSPEFVKSPRLSQFLTYVVQETLSGRADQLKESTIGLAVFGRDPSWDPKTDSVVRTEAVKLRQKLRLYYQGEGRDDATSIELPKGSYVPRFTSAAPTNGTRIPRYTRRWAVVLVVITLALGLLGFTSWRQSRGTAEARTPPKLTRITADTASSVQPSLSPSGDFVAYSSNRGDRGDYDIYVQPVNGSNAIRLTTDPAEDSLPVFSPDGSEIAFVRRRKGLFVVPSVGGAERMIVADASCPRYSPDGKWLSFDRPKPMPEGVPGSGKIFIVPSSGGEPKQICSNFVSAHNPIWTPDGKHLLFLGAKDADTPTLTELDWWVTPVEGCNAAPTGVSKLLPRDPLDTNAKVPVWPEGHGLPPRYWHGNGPVFTSHIGRPSVWRMPLSPQTWKSTGPPEVVTLGTGATTFSSHAVGKVAFEDRETVGTVHVLPVNADRAEATGPLRTVAEYSELVLSPSLSADGRQLAFWLGP